MAQKILFNNLPDDDVLYDALLAKDSAYDGLVFVGVKSTGIFCRLSCSARKPKRENTTFFLTAKAAMESGFRPCLRCRPLAHLSRQDPLVSELMLVLEKADHTQEKLQESNLVEMGYDPSTVRRAFQRTFGMTFLEMARIRRLSHGAQHIAHGGSVLDAQLDAQFKSGSGFRLAFKQLLGQTPANVHKGAMLKADWLDTPIGAMLAIADAHALHLLEFHDRKALATEIKTLQKKSGAIISMGRFPAIDQIEAELQSYFSGNLSAFQTPLAKEGSPFYLQVWNALCQIPVGSTRSYAQVARIIDKPSAVRAVARGNGANKIAIVIPCHRVIGADGSLTGYAGGLWRKRWLLEHERRMAQQLAV